MKAIALTLLIGLPSIAFAQAKSSDSIKANTVVSSDTQRCSNISLPLALDRVSTMNRMAIANGDIAKNYFEQPENKECLYSVKWMIPIQKMANGYLLDVNPDSLTPAETGIHQFAFLYTGENFKSNQSLTDYSPQVVYAGIYKYTSLDGFDQEVHAFKFPNSEKARSVKKVAAKHPAKGK